MSIGQIVRCFFVFFIFLSYFLIIPRIAFAETNLSNNEAINLLRSAIYEPSSDNFINTLISSGSNNIDKQAVLMTVKNAVQYQSLNYAFVEIPKDLLVNFLKKGYFLLSLYGTGFENIMTELEKESAKEAKRILNEWLNENQIKLASGYIDKYKFVSYKGNKQDPVFGYNIIVKPKKGGGENKKISEVFIEFYSPEFIEPEGLRGHDLMFGNYWNEEDWVSLKKDRIPPFIIRVNGDVEEKYANSYDWLDGYMFEVIFNEPVPEVEIPTLADRIRDKIKEKIEEYLSNPFFNINIFKAQISEIIVSQMPGSGSPDFYSRLDDLVENQCFDNVCPGNPWIIDDAISIEDILDDISEKIDILVEKIAELTGNKEAGDEEYGDLKEDNKDKAYGTLGFEPTWCVKTDGSLPLMNKIIINEVAWMGSSISSSDEWIEIKNISDNSVNLEGWQILDKGKQIKIYFDDKYVVSSAGILLLERTDDNSVPFVMADYIYSGALSDTNESLMIFDKNCILQDEVAADPTWPAGDKISKKTMERDKALNWHDYSGIGRNGIMGTPKMENSEPGTPGIENKILISEIQTAGESDEKEEFVELYNPNDKDVDLSNWYIEKKTKSGAVSYFDKKSLFSGKIISAKGHFLIAREGYFTGLADISVDAALSDDSTLVLKNSDEEISDKVGWGQASDYEEEPAENPVRGDSLARRLFDKEYVDTDNNRLDFKDQKPTPSKNNGFGEQQIWPVFQRDSKHTGRSDFPIGLNLGISWTYELANIDSDCLYPSGQPVIDSQGMVYYGFGQNSCKETDGLNKVSAINPDGTLKWEFSELSFPPSYISIGNDNTLYVSSKNKMYALNSNGTKKWEFSADSDISASIIGLDGLIYFTSYSNIYCLDSDGNKKWENSGVPRGGSASNGPAIGNNGTIYAAWTGFRNGTDEQRGYIFAYDGENGTVKWQSPLKYEAESPSVGENGDIYVITDDIYNLSSQVHLFNQNDGENRANIYLDHGALSVPAIDSDGNVVVLDNWSASQSYEPYSQLASFNQNGLMLWNTGEQASSSIRGEVIIDNQGTIIFQKIVYEKYGDLSFKSVKAVLMGVDGSNGNEKWQVDLPDNIISNFALSDSGTLYFATKEETEGKIKINLYAFGTGGVPLRTKEKLELSDDFELNDELNFMVDILNSDLELEFKEEFEIENDLFSENFDFENDFGAVNQEVLIIENSNQNMIENPEKPEQLEIIEEPVQQNEDIEVEETEEVIQNAEIIKLPESELTPETESIPEIIPIPEP